MLDSFAARAGALALIALGATAVRATPLRAQHEHMQMDGDTSKKMQMIDPLGVSMDRMGSGTTWTPDAVILPSRHLTMGDWDVMFHGFAFVEGDVQRGPRGGSQLGVLNWGMLMASRSVLGGRFQGRAMLSFEPATIGGRGYPLLLQTGESYGGQPLHDRQHPHDFLMELAVMYERAVGKSLGVELYAAPAGEPALGPIAFMHRPSAMDVPTAPLGHHWQDATHISFGVVTAGVFGKQWKLEGSVFNGREPDEHRWDVDPLRLDSYSGRLTVNPDDHWSLTAGHGWLKSPEGLNPTESVHRTTASVLHGVKIGEDGSWSTALVWGANTHGGATTHSLLAESEAAFESGNIVFGRAEWVQKSAEELVLPPIEYAATRQFNVGAVSLGYVREVAKFNGMVLGAGGMGTVNVVPSSLEAVYGSRAPLGLMVFVRVRPAGGGSMAGMEME